MCPQIFSAELYKTSGHYENFAGDFFLFPGSEEGEELGVKPMNCPGHCLVFRSRKRSYRELPLRMAEFSRLHRNERTGSLHGMTRVRSMAQDDGHIYCTWEDIKTEIDGFMKLCNEVDRDLGFSGVSTFVSTRPEKFIGSVETWERAERMLIDAVESTGAKCASSRGGASGPRSRPLPGREGRWWQLGTMQIDTAMPGRFGSYIGPDGAEHEPAMLHRAVLGSLERFIAIYLEHTAGDFPVFLAPQQVAVLPISDRQADYAREIADRLRAAAVRAEADLRSETLNYRVRAAETQKIPFALVVGDREQASRSVSVRRRKGSAQEVMPLEQFEKNIQEEIRTRGIP
jgi:threonyl-tRNA synthetase